jgi:hypothetical protein
MAYTPGPWHFYDDSNDGKTNRIEITALGKTIAHIYHSVPEEDLPNARLISAAPDLLEALHSLLLWNAQPSDDDAAFEAAHAAIAKAEGKG